MLTHAEQQRPTRRKGSGRTVYQHACAIGHYCKSDFSDEIPRAREQLLCFRAQDIPQGTDARRQGCFQIADALHIVAQLELRHAQAAQRASVW
jgi:hypothetical protein